MSIQLLTTKFFVPPLHSKVLHRPTLVKCIHDSLDKKLTLISAPAGFGKTTLLIDWVRTSNLPVAWVSLDANDNETRRFWGYLITAINKIYEDIGGTSLTDLQSPRPLSSNKILTGLINDIVGVGPNHFVVVLDDYHLIDNPEIHQGITFLVENCPPALHIALLTRSDPPFPLSRWRVRREMNELRTEDFRFSINETTELFNDVLDLALRKEDIEVLERKTEGWITGLQMAAISIKGILQTKSETDVLEFIDSFTGSHRYILDYLVEEVISQQDNEVQDFLFKTAILNRLTESLCQYLTGNKKSQKILKKLERKNLFIIPLDDESRWFRYHHLFVDLLRNQLTQRKSENISSLHGLASHWFEKNGWYAEALKHALQMDDLDRIVQLVEDNATSMIYQGELTTLVRWLDQLPENITNTRPWLTISHAWALLFSGRLASLEKLIHNVEHKYTNLPKSKPASEIEVDNKRLNGHIAAIRGHITYFEGNYNKTISFSTQALDQLAKSDVMARSLSIAILIASLRWLGDLKSATKAANEALEVYQSTDDKSILVTIYFNLAKTKYLAGELKEVYTACLEALKLEKAANKDGSRLLFNIGYIFGCMSIILLEWNNLELAMEYAKKSIETCKQWGQVDALADGYLQLARIMQAVGKQKEAIRTMKKAEQIVQQYSPKTAAYMSANLAKLNLKQGNEEAFTKWADMSGLTIHDELEIHNISLYIILTRVLIFQKRFEDALNLLIRLEELVEKTGLFVYHIEILILQAIAWQEIKEEYKALRRIKLAVSKAKSQEFVRIFIDEGIQIQRLLYQLIVDGYEVNYIRHLINELDNETKISKTYQNPVGTLTVRELDVLKLLTTPATHAQIADQLYISRNTVRSHIKSIYSKLNVNSRLQAIQKARELDLTS